MKLRGYQRECIDSANEWWDNCIAERRPANALVVLPTGGGKTVVFSQLGKEKRGEGLRRILVLAHRNELVKQAVEKWLTIDPHESLGIYQGGRRDLHCDVIAASVASCYPDVYREEDCACTAGAPIVDDGGWPTGKCEKLKANPDCAECQGNGKVRRFVRPGRIHELPLAEIDLIIIDEVHHATRDSLYWHIIEAVRAVNPDCLVLGATATPYRADGQGLGHLFEAACFSRGIKWMVEHGYLAPPVGRRVELQIDLSQVAVSKTSGDFKDKDLGEVMDQAEARSQIVRAWMEHAGPGTYAGDPRGRPTAVFCPTVEAAEHLCEEFVAGGVLADWICSDKKLCDDAKRQRVLLDFDEGRLPVVVNVGILTEGWDAKRTACIVVARPTKSIGLYVQIVGRGLRWMGKNSTKEESEALGKADCLVLDCTGASALGLISLADLSDDIPEPKKKKAKATPTAVIEDLFPDEFETKKIIGYSTFEVDLFGGGVDWCRVNGARVAALDAGKTLVIFQVGAAFTVMLTGKTLQILAAGLPEMDALKLAETYAMENGQRRFLKPGDWFQRKPATEKQRLLLAKLVEIDTNKGRVDMPEPGRMSMQQASAWAGYLLARRQYSEAVVRRARDDTAA